MGKVRLVDDGTPIPFAKLALRSTETWKYKQKSWPQEVRYGLSDLFGNYKFTNVPGSSILVTAETILEQPYYGYFDEHGSY